MQLDRYLEALQLVGGGTIALLVLMCTVAAMKVRAQLANVVLMVVIYPIMLALSVAVYIGFSVNEMFNAKKMAEWLIYVVASGTVGTSLTILVMAGLSRLWENSTAR